MTWWSWWLGRWSNVRSKIRLNFFDYEKGDALATNLGNQLNTPRVDLSNSRFTGDVVTCVWDVTDTNPAHRDL